MAEFLDTKGVDTAIKQFEKCLNSKGLKVKIDPKRKNEPGLENLLFTIIEFFDKIYATALAPYAKLVDLAKRVKAALTDPPKLAEIVKKVNELIQEIQKAVSNIIQFVVEKVVEPLKKFAIPLTLPIGPLNIALSGKIDDIKDAKRKKALKKLAKGDGAESQTRAQEILSNATAKAAKAQQAGSEAVAAAQKELQDAKDYVAKIIKEIAKGPEWVIKQVTLLLSFVQTGIDFILSTFKLAIDALKSPVKKLLELLSNLIKNPVKLFLDLLKKALEPILIALAKKFSKVKESVSKVKTDIKNFLNLVFSLKKIDLKKFASKVFQAVSPVFGLIACSLTFAITFLPTVIKSLLKF
jgi:phage-related protein